MLCFPPTRTSAVYFWLRPGVRSFLTANVASEILTVARVSLFEQLPRPTMLTSTRDKCLRHCRKVV